MALTANQITVGLYGIAAGGFKTTVDDAIAAFGSAATVAALLPSTGLNPSFMGEDLYDNEQFVAGLTAQVLFELSADMQALVTTAVANFMDANPTLSRGEVAAAYLEAVAAIPASDPVLGSAAAAFNAMVALGEASTSTSTDLTELAAIVGNEAPSLDTTVYLTTGQDDVAGGAGADNFIAYIFNNSNSLQSGDMIDGGAGIDSLFADIGSSQNFAITAHTNNIETAAFRVQADQAGNDDGDNNIAGVGIIDAERMDGVTTYEDNNSRADLVVEDIRIQDDEITSDITIVMRDTDPGNVDYGVYFDQNSLRNFSNSTSFMNLRVLDTYATAQGLDELQDSPYGSFTFWASVDGGDYVSITLASDAMQDAQTLDEMVTAMQAAADDYFGAANVVTVALGDTYTVPDSVTGDDVTGTEIVITAEADVLFDVDLAGSGWLATETVPAVSGLYTSFNQDSDSTTALVTSTIVLDNVGRGSNGGDLIVGGLSTGLTSSSNGVQQFDITVEDNSKLSNILSTNNTLQVVNIVNGSTDEMSDAYTTTVEDAGNLSVGVSNDQDSDLVSGGTAQEDSAYGFTDVQTINASTMTGMLSFTAEITADSIDKYIDLEDTADSPTADNVAFAYTGGTNNDSMDVEIDATVAGSRSTIVSGQSDFTFAIDGGSGNDAITVQIRDTTVTGGLDAWYSNQNLNNNITISGGAGNDEIRTPGAGDTTIDAGTGNDVVFADNTGKQAALTMAGTSVLTNPGFSSGTGGVWGTGNETSNAVWVFNTANQNLANPVYQDVDDLRSDSNDSYNLFDVDVTVDFKGLGSTTVTLANTSTYKVTDLEINQAIKNAINNDAVLKHLLVAKDGPANSLIVESLIDGAPVDPTVTFTLPVAADLSAAEVLAAATAWGVTTPASATAADMVVYMTNGTLGTFAGASATVSMAALTTKADYIADEGTDGVTAIVGANSTTVSDNFITPGSGDDLVVLGTTLGATDDQSSNDVVVYGTSFGNDTIVNFTTTAVSALGADHLSFSSILGGAAAWGAAAFSGTNRSISVVVDADTNDTAAEIKTLFDADAAENATASTHLYIVYDAVTKSVGQVFSIADGTGADDATVTLQGSIDLADVDWDTLALADFTVPTVYAEGPTAALTTGLTIAVATGATNATGTTLDDTFNVAAANSGTLTGAGGNDTFNMIGTSTSTIADLSSGDTVVFTVGASAVTSTALNLTGVTATDTITGSSFILNGTAAADTIVGSTINDVITGGALVDNITTGTGSDIVVIGATDLTNANRDVVTDFAVATDSIRVDATLVNGGTGVITDGLIAGEFQAAAAAGAYTVGANEVVLELAFEFDADVALATATKTTLLSALGAADDATAASITAGTLAMTAAGNEALVIAYQGGDAYLFRVTSGADADITVADADDLVVLVGTYENVAVGAFTFADFVA